MKTYEFKLPDIGEGVSEGEIVKWLVSPGQVVREDDPMVEVMTDKATVTITAPKAGTILETRGAEGQVVAVHAVLVVFQLPSDGDDAETVGDASVAPTQSAASAVGDIKETLPGMHLAATKTTAVVNGQAKRSGYFNEKPLATPATRRLARELGVDLRTVPPSQESGRVTQHDVQRRLSSLPQAEPLPDRGRDAAMPSMGVGVEQLPLPPPAMPRSDTSDAPRAAGRATLEDRIPLRGVRKRIFETMARSKQTAAHFTFVEECDVTALRALRARLQPAAAKANVNLTYLPLIVKAAVAALRKHPTLNSSFDESTQEIVLKRFYDIGIASATDAGLIVPVVRAADQKSILEVAREIQRLGDDSKAGKVKPEDLGGSTFTITSLGAQGGLLATPILNYPEVAILGVHRMKQRPVVRDGQIVIGDVMLLSLSFDHRLVDGHVGAAFAYEIISYLEDPDRLFLEMA